MYNVHREWHWLLARKSDVSKTSHLLKPSLWGVKLCKSIAMNIMRCKDGKGEIFDTWPQQLHRPSRGILSPWPCISRTCLRKIPDMNAMSWTVQELHCRCKTFTAATSGIFRVHFDLWAVSVKYKRLKCTKYRREVFTKWPQQLHRALGYFESLPAHQGGALL